MEIHAASVYNAKTIRAVNDVHMFRRKNPRTQKILLAVCLVIPVIILAVVMAVTGYETSVARIIVAVAALAAVLMAAVLFLPLLVSMKSRRTPEVTNKFVFGDYGFTVNSTSEGVEGRSEVAYASVSKVYDSSQYLFIYINQNTVMAVEKSSMEGDGAAQLKERLFAVLGKRKYKVCKY